ncbi:MAG: LysM peptidoglycan-binding domain-containing protein, partial [Lautropia sp.]
MWLLALLATLPAGLTLAEGTSTGGTPAAPSATANPADNEILLYHVQPGDTLLGLSREKLDTPERWRDVQKLNHIGNPRHLQPGTTLRMLPGWLKPKVAQALLESASNQVKLNGKPAQDGAAIPEGTTVQTGPDSAAVITLPDGTRLRIPSATEVRLERLRAYHGERHLDAGFLLRHGSIEPDSPGKRSRPLNIRTPSGNAAVRGTHFRVHAEGQRSTVEVLRGRVAAGNRKATADVDAGKGTWFTAKSKPVVAQLLPAPDLGGIQGRTWTQTAPHLPLPALAGDAAAYHVEVSTRPDFSAVLLDTRTREPGFVLPSRQDGPHYVRVSAISRTGIEGYVGTTEVQV